MNKPVRVFAIGDARKCIEELNKIVGVQKKSGKKNSSEIQLLKSIQDKIELIKANPFYGDNVRKNLIPKNCDVQNLWRVGLNNFWRMLYTIRGDEVEIICFLMNIVNHKDYNKLFGYK